jgi:hypothetical protein
MNIRFSGHETFACRYAWLPKAAKAVSEDPTILTSAREDDAMVELGVGKNMVRSIRFWAESSDVIQPGPDRHDLTEFGARLLLGWCNGDGQFEEALDPYLEDIQTLWLLHWKLATNRHSLIFAWDFLFNRFQEPELHASSVTRAFCKALTQVTDREISAGSLQQLWKVFLHSYVPTRARREEVREDNLDCPFVELELLLHTGFAESVNKSAVAEPKYAFRREEKPEIGQSLFAYCLNEFWHDHFPDEQSMPFHRIVVGHGSPGQIFKIPEADIRNRLLSLETATQGALIFEESAAIPRVIRQKTKRSVTLTSIYTLETARA